MCFLLAFIHSALPTIYSLGDYSARGCGNGASLFTSPGFLACHFKQTHTYSRKFVMAMSGEALGKVGLLRE